MAQYLISQRASLILAPCAMAGGCLAAVIPLAAGLWACWLHGHPETGVRARHRYTGRAVVGLDTRVRLQRRPQVGQTSVEWLVGTVPLQLEPDQSLRRGKLPPNGLSRLHPCLRARKQQPNRFAVGWGGGRGTALPTTGVAAAAATAAASDVASTAPPPPLVRV